MSKTIVFKPKFERKLKKLRIKTKFVKNLTVKGHLSNFNYPDLENHNTIAGIVEYLNNRPSFNDFLRDAFAWSDTEEGFDYWHNLCNV